MQKGIFVVLVVIALLLAANLFNEKESHAAKKFEYKLVNTMNVHSVELAESFFSKQADQGYEFVGEAVGGSFAVFKR